MMQTLAIEKSDLHGMLWIAFLVGMFAGVAVRVFIAWIWHLLKKPQP